MSRISSLLARANRFLGRVAVRTAPYSEYIAAVGFISAVAAMLVAYTVAVGWYIAGLWNASIGKLFGLRKMTRKEGLALFCLAQALFRPSWLPAKKEKSSAPSVRISRTPSNERQRVGFGTSLDDRASGELAAQFIADMESLFGKPKLD